VEDAQSGRPGSPGIEPLYLGARLETERRDHCVVAVIAGDLDLASVTMLRDRLHGHVYAGTQHLVLDLSQVGFVDSAGLSMLVGLRRILAARGGMLHLAAGRPGFVELLRLTALTRTFTLHETVADAESAAAAASLP
jgi:stage II sporulation protein AA (anti-sigma F factor antagonist)